MRDIESGDEEVVAPAVAASALSFSPTEDKLVFARIGKADSYGSRQSDIYTYAFSAKDPSWIRSAAWLAPALVRGYGDKPAAEERLSRGLRALCPDYSPDGKWIAFVRNGGTNNNLGLMRADRSDVRDLTQIADGTQLYSPAFHLMGRILPCQWRVKDSAILRY